MSKRWWIYAGLAVVAGGVVWWGLRPLDAAPPSAGTVAVATGAGSVAPLPSATVADPVASAPSAPPSAPVRDSRFQLLRVGLAPADAPQRPAEAVIAVDGLPPKVYRVGDAVVGAVVLQSVQPTSATLGPAGGPAALVLGITAPGAAMPQATAGADSPPVIRAASSPPVNRTPVAVPDADHGVDTSNR